MYRRGTDGVLSPEECPHQDGEQDESSNARGDPDGHGTARAHDVSLPACETTEHSNVTNARPYVDGDPGSHEGNAGRRCVRASWTHVGAHCGEFAQEESEASHDKAEPHERDARADPRQEGPLGSERNARVKIIRRQARHRGIVLRDALLLRHPSRVDEPRRECYSISRLNT